MAGSVTATAVTATFIGAAVAAAGQLQQASAQKAAADYQAKVATGNQTIATQNANFAAAEGEQKAAVQEQKTRAQEGEILAGQASSGVDVNSTTSKAVRASESEVGALDANTIKSNAIRQAYGFETQATNFGNEAEADIATGKNAKIAGYFGAASGLLSGVGGAGLNYAKAIGSGSGIDSSGDNITGNGGNDNISGA